MAQTKTQIQAMLSQAGMQPRYRFGQNFMIDQNLVRVIADAGMVQPGDRVLEVGPGTGTLTDELLSRGVHVTAVEIDRDLAAMLREHFAENPQFTLIEGDALAGKHALCPEILQWMTAAKQSAQPTRLVANLPYNIASPLVIELLIAGIDTLAFTVQKEVADRLRAPAGSEDYGPLSVMAQMLSTVEMLRTLPPQAFWPMPKIDSALVRMIRVDRLGNRAMQFGTFVHQVFSSRRKTLRRGLTQAGYNAAIMLEKTGIKPELRPEMLTPEQLMQLFDAIE